MSVKIKITGRGIYGADGEIAVGTELTLRREPVGWKGRYIVLSNDTEGEFVTGEATSDRDALKARADALGIEYAKNIPTDKLAAAVADAEKA